MPTDYPTNQELFRLFLEHTPVAIAMFDRQMRYMVASRKWLNDYCLDNQNIIGCSYYEVLPKIPDRWQKIHRRCLAGSVERSEEDVFLRADGTTDWVKWEIHPWRDSAGKIGGLIIFTEAIIKSKQVLAEANEELEIKVEERTLKLKQAIKRLKTEITERKQAEDALRQSEAQLRQQTQQMEKTLKELQQTQAKLVQTEKMSSLGQLVAGVAHEINNPVNFIYGNLNHINQYTQNLLNLIHSYQKHYPKPVAEIQAEIEAIELDFLIDDLPKILNSMNVGAERIRQIVLSLRNFSRHDESEMKAVDIHEGIDNTLLLLQNRLKAKSNHPEIRVMQEYGNLPRIYCYAGQLNQVFMNLLTNAIDAMDDYNQTRSQTQIKRNPSTITIRTEVKQQEKTNPNSIVISISDNGPGMNEAVRERLFDPFFTTKPVGKGTGLGLAISYEIVVEKHKGQLECISSPGKGAQFIIEIPLQQPLQKLTPNELQVYPEKMQQIESRYLEEIQQIAP